MVVMIRVELTDERWQRLEPLLPPERGRPGRPLKENRGVVSAILWVQRTGAPWRDLPPGHGPWQTAYSRFRRWTQRGIWTRALAELAQDVDDENLILDSTTVRAHQHAAGARGDPQARRWGVLAAASARRSTSPSMGSATRCVFC
jgi:transposase